MISSIIDWFKASSRSFGFKFYLSTFVLGAGFNAFLCFIVIAGFATLHSFYIRNTIEITKSQVENILAKAYEDFLKKRSLFQSLDPAYSEELLESIRSEAEREVERTIRAHSAPNIGIELILANEPYSLIHSKLIEFESLHYKKYLGASRKAYLLFFLKISLIIIIFIFLLSVPAFILLRYLYLQFRNPLDSITNNLEKGEKLNYTGYTELDALISAIESYTNREKELLSQQHRLQLELEKSARLSAIGTMAGGYAHEFNNLLQMILFNLELAEKALKEGNQSAVDKHLENIKKITARGQNLARKILYFTKDIPGETAEVCQEIKNLIDALRVMVPREIELNIEFHCQRSYIVPLSPNSLKEILLNLVKNAVDAIEEVKDRIEKKEIKISVSVLNEKELLLEVSDTGCGMSDEVKAKLFTPFFTTKGFEKGSGLGLFIVYNLVKNTNGRIEVESKPMEGTTFKIFLPVVEKKITEEKGLEEKLKVEKEVKPKEIKSILVADDEDDIRDALREFLEELGYVVDIAKNGKEALEAILAKDYDLVLLDMYMPEMNGVEVLSKLKTADRIPPYVVLMTGYAGDVSENIARFTQEGVIKYILRKPFTFQDLEAIIKG